LAVPAVGILEGDEPEQEQRESLEGLLADLLSAADVEPVLNQILEKWASQRAQSGALLTQQEEKKVNHTDISDQLHQIMEQKMSAFSAKKVEKSQEELQMKAAILASYSQVCS
jgi:Fe-S cluster assembly ATPase SufC